MHILLLFLPLQAEGVRAGEWEMGLLCPAYGSDTDLTHGLEQIILDIFNISVCYYRWMENTQINQQTF